MDESLPPSTLLIGVRIRRLFLFRSAVDTMITVLAVVGVVCAVIGVFSLMAWPEASWISTVYGVMAMFLLMVAASLALIKVT